MKNPDLTDRFVTYFLVTTILLGSIIFVSVSAKELLLDYRYSDVVFLSQDMQRDKRRSSDTIARYAQQVASIPADGVCRSDILKSGLAILLTDLDNQNPQKDYDRWASAIDSTRIYITHALTCLPTDGNLWLRLAMVSRAVAEQPDYIAALLAQSQRLAPAEATIVGARLLFYNRLTKNTLAQSRTTVIKDLVTAFRFEPRMLNTMVKRPSPAFRPYIDDAIAACGPDCKIPAINKS